MIKTFIYWNTWLLMLQIFKDKRELFIVGSIWCFIHSYGKYLPFLISWIILFLTRFLPYLSAHVVYVWIEMIVSFVPIFVFFTSSLSTVARGYFASWGNFAHFEVKYRVFSTIWSSRYTRIGYSLLLAIPLACLHTYFHFPNLPVSSLVCY